MLIMHEVLQDLEKSLDGKQNLPIYDNLPSLPWTKWQDIQHMLILALSLPQHLKYYKKKGGGIIACVTTVPRNLTSKFYVLHSFCTKFKCNCWQGSITTCLSAWKTGHVSFIMCSKALSSKGYFFIIYSESACQWCSGMSSCPECLLIKSQLYSAFHSFPSHSMLEDIALLENTYCFITPQLVFRNSPTSSQKILRQLRKWEKKWEEELWFRLLSFVMCLL